MGRRLIGTEKETFLSRFKVNENGCWVWTGSKRGGTYGLFCYGHKREAAHRAAYRLLVGEIPTGMHVCHRCDNPPCVNPDHLFLGTHADNMKDKMQKGRWSYGFQHSENHGEAKLTNQKVSEIIQLLKQKVPRKVIAEQYDVHYTTVSHIAQGRNWKRIPRD